jgi:uncharacterized protein (DUF302 family)
MSTSSIPGFISKLSPHSVPETIQRLSALLKSKGVAIFALIDHSGETEKAGLKMRPTQLLIFGNPKGGTPLMLAAPSTAIDLPLKALVWEDADGKVWLSYNSPDYLQQRHGFPADLEKNIAAIEPLLAQVVANNSRGMECPRNETPDIQSIAFAILLALR